MNALDVIVNEGRIKKQNNYEQMQIALNFLIKLIKFLSQVSCSNWLFDFAEKPNVIAN